MRNSDDLVDDREAVASPSPPAPAIRPPSANYSFGPTSLWLTGQTLLMAAVVFFLVRGWERDFRVPFQFDGDGLMFLMLGKSTVDNGWWWSNPMLGAPFGYDALAFPANSNVDHAVIWVLGHVARNPAEALNLAWLALVILSGLTAAWCMRRVGASPISAIVFGTLFALSPYALYRNLDHFALVVYLVPFPCVAALLLASGQPLRSADLQVRRGGRWWKGTAGILVGCALVGFNYIYYAFFATFLIVVAAVVGWVAHRDRRVLGAGALCVAVILGSTLLNLAPSLYSWSRHGTPVILIEKAPAESERYGLKIRQLISPVYRHLFPPFREWTELETAAAYPLETENTISRLGFVGTLGFLGLLGLLFVPSVTDRLPVRSTLVGASQLTLAAVLLATIGGFGSLFNLLVSPEIRAYNRICPFIEFFSLAAAALAIDSLFAKRGSRMIVAAIVLVVGLSDQRRATVPLNAQHPAVATETHALEAFVRQLEDRLPERAMVFQLPMRPYLNDVGTSRLRPYDHLKLYAVSRKIRWSYPALSNAQVYWQQAAGRIDPKQLPYQLAAEGFAAISIDRFGYDDNGAAVIADMSAGLREGDVIARSDRYIAIDIRSLAGASAVATPPLAAAPLLVTPSLEACQGQSYQNVERIGEITSPFDGSPISVDDDGEFKVTGWAVDSGGDVAAKGVDVVVDRTPFPTVYGTERPDVADYFKRPRYRDSGFTTAIPAERLGNGRHTLSLRIVASEGTCYYESPGITIVVD